MSTSVAVITGGSAGIGRATAIAFARRGWRVAVLARGEDGLAATRADIERAGGEALTIATDVADPGQVEAAAERIERELGPIDVWINNAMATILAPLSEIAPDEYRRSTEVTYLGSVWGTMTALRRMRPRDRGTIVQVGSALAYRGIPLQSAYCGAKHAVQGFADSLRTELLHDGSRVTVGMIQLPAMNTPQFGWVRSRLPKKAQPVPPVYQPEVAAEAIFHMARHPRREMYVGWPTYEAIIGNKIAPGLADRYLARNGVESQQTDEPEDPGRPDNLDRPVDDVVDHGMHGTFGAIARPRSELLALDLHRGLVAGCVLGLAAAWSLSRLRR